MGDAEIDENVAEISVGLRLLLFNVSFNLLENIAHLAIQEKKGSEALLQKAQDICLTSRLRTYN